MCVRILLSVAIVLATFVIGCVENGPVPDGEILVDPSASPDSNPDDPSLASPQNRCVCRDFGIIDDSVALPLHDEDAITLLNEEKTEALCTVFSIPQHFQIEKEHPRRFLLETSPNVTYCVEVVRGTGYLTLSHAEGEGVVTRDENIFEWCLSRSAALNPAELTVRSLTPRAGFWIQLKRL